MPAPKRHDSQNHLTKIVPTFPGIVDTVQNETKAVRMTWSPIESKMFTSAAYDAAKATLYLRFQSGEVYRYFNFPDQQYQSFLSADSKGRYFLTHIRDRFPYQRLAKLHAA